MKGFYLFAVTSFLFAGFMFHEIVMKPKEEWLWRFIFWLCGVVCVAAGLSAVYRGLKQS